MNAPVTAAEQFSIVLATTPDLMSEIGQHNGVIDIAKAYVIDSHDMAKAAVSERNGWLKAIDMLKARRKKFIEPAEKIIENAKELFNPTITGLENAIAMLNGGLIEWDRKEKARVVLENQQREEAARKARQEAEQKAAVERARAEEQAAAERRKAADAEEARKKAVAEGNARAAAAAAAEGAKAREREQAALENGAAKATEAHLAAAAVTTAAAPVEQLKLDGNTMRSNWTYRLQKGLTEDQAKAQIAAACAARPELLAFLKIDTAALGKGAKTFKKAFNVPGYEAFDDPVAAGSKK